MLNSSDEIILSAMLENPTVEAAAAACKLPEAVIHRRLQDAEFKAAYLRRREQLIQKACGALRGELAETMHRLAGIANDPAASKSVRSQASKAVFGICIKIVETLDALPRLEALKKAAAKSGSEA